MGNHEYCTGCGASDFHSGMSCEEAYPEKWANKQIKRKAKQDILDARDAHTAKLVKATLDKGKKSLIARFLQIDLEKTILEQRMNKITAKMEALGDEEAALAKHCPHPKKYIESGFCNLCNQVDI